LSWGHDDDDNEGKRPERGTASLGDENDDMQESIWVSEAGGNQQRPICVDIEDEVFRNCILNKHTSRPP
jgi:hypothetical protein